MRSMLLGLLIGCGLAAMVAPVMACEFHNSAQNTQSTSQQTAQAQPAEAQPAAQSGSN